MPGCIKYSSGESRLRGSASEAASQIRICTTVRDYMAAAVSGATQCGCGLAVATGHGFEFVSVQFADFVARLSHVIPLLIWGLGPSRARGDRSMRRAGAPAVMQITQAPRRVSGDANPAVTASVAWCQADRLWTSGAF
jgi:hypothetical protein